MKTNSPSEATSTLDQGRILHTVQRSVHGSERFWKFEPETPHMSTYGYTGCTVPKTSQAAADHTTERMS